MPVTVGAIILHMGPDTVGGPDSLEAPIIDFIGAAQSELLVSVQELDHRPIAEALITARRRGVRVQMILEQDYLREQGLPPSDGLGVHEINRELLTRVLRVGVDAKADYNPSIFHQKFIVRDRAALMTGSTNFTTTGVTKNLNHIAVIEDIEVAREYAREFRQMRKGIFGKRSLEVPRKPLEGHFVSGVRTKPLFAPDHAPEMEFIKQMIKAKSRIDFAVFTFAQSSGIDDALVNAHEKGLRLNGVLDRRQANQKWAAKHTLTAAGVTLHRNRTGTGVRKIHHKLMVIDDALTIIGSFNYTGPANLVNDENIIVLGDLDLPPGQVRDDQAKLAAYARAEIDRIITTQSEPIPT
ncbi:phospholipase D-like domain-containing protein [Yoonia sediminilitoris]|uniref:Phospholipase D n=1 Tax=Yoonia sediminilitoris TaxID=1286148 RepID=A0A2T6KR50_9RHOB|nr:phospholipase D-like domain-containing protein [Yoonia sediminilitoris]PUB19029.1 phosphatidylserine/phosphatidylglycerophosphate/cardiolipin synthase-like enzyme [Yoonia sediminilitoris]RCW99197.1 phosphatidylserine/phosphatidylglycerophosphate/cardiolipin synthase-like enzyme [Yoonia sediminilitoris]